MLDATDFDLPCPQPPQLKWSERLSWVKRTRRGSTSPSCMVDPSRPGWASLKDRLDQLEIAGLRALTTTSRDCPPAVKSLYSRLLTARE